MSELPDVRPGQVWADNDKRAKGRTLRVVRVGYDERRGYQGRHLHDPDDGRVFKGSTESRDRQGPGRVRDEGCGEADAPELDWLPPGVRRGRLRVSTKDKLAKAWERIVLGSDDGQEAADDLRKAQEEANKKQEGRQ